MPQVLISGPTVSLRYATPADAPRLFELGSDPAVTQWFSWGPYSVEGEATAYIRSLETRRESGELLEFLIEHRDDGVIGITGLSELAARDRRATVGTWLGRAWWGSGANAESKALVAHLAFTACGLDRLTAWANARNGRSAAALERLGFVREGVLRGWHRHGDERHDALVFRMDRRDWAASPLAAVEVAIEGEPPTVWRVG